MPSSGLACRRFTVGVEGRYGAPRIHAELIEGGVAVSRKRVARVMRSAGIAGVSRRRGPRTTRRNVQARPAPDRVERRFEADAPNRLWVADITYVPTLAGFLYLAIVLDVFSRRVVGWAMAGHLRTALVVEALEMAVDQRQLIDRCTAFRPGDIINPTTSMKHALRALATRWRMLSAEIATHDEVLDTITWTAAPTLHEAFGIGTDSVAEMLIVAGDNPTRIHSEAAFAKLCGACPVPASSGVTNRHRLFRGGHRQANAALYRIVLVRMRWHQPTIDYVRRRTAEGLSKKGLPQNLWVERRAGSPRQTHSVPVCSPPSRRVAPLRPRCAGLTAWTPAARTSVPALV